MDLKQFVDGMGAMTCVVSVEDLGNGKYGDIRIVTGNQAYIDLRNRLREQNCSLKSLFRTRFIPDI